MKILRRSERDWLKRDIDESYLEAGELGYDITNKELRIGDGKSEFYNCKTFIERYSINRMSIIMGLLAVIIGNVSTAITISITYRVATILKRGEQVVVFALLMSSIISCLLIYLIDRMLNKHRRIRSKLRIKLIEEREAREREHAAKEVEKEQKIKEEQDKIAEELECIENPVTDNEEEEVKQD